ncbi:MAG: pilus assembly protein [Rothia sp. (in: high G+C Gram-positive bacteria)]|uniref:TadE family protein n=1 Tax=Rothia sp. (in: high G+C Gram-positive bacteria) TaxID=1885016 RepID=UPI0026E112E3|nr:TadE family protein [Rothia sp. (in: high G+C Gram-positive bacteria)]MDO5749885.1 pilus assembly protein [Rothia sp. (in: high G+C Gram-positive bacteria)]
MIIRGFYPGCRHPPRRATSNRAAHRAREAEHGAITAEFAVALPAIILVLTFCLGALSVGIAQIRVDESARVAARELARGADESTALRAARDIEPQAQLQVAYTSENVQVRAERRAPGIIGSMTGWVLSSSSTVRVEELNTGQPNPDSPPEGENENKSEKET